jgi:hypothetical protein
MDDDLDAFVQFMTWRSPFREGEYLELWRGHIRVIALPYNLVMRAVRIYLDGAMLQTAVAQRLAARKPLAAARALPFTPDKRRALKVQRQKNKGRRSMKALLILAMVLAGCVTAQTLPELASRYSGVDKDSVAQLERFRIRHNDCRRMSRATVNIGGGLIGAVATGANIATASNDFEQCMQDGGYVYNPTPDEIAQRAAFYREHCESVHRGRPTAIEDCARR